MESALFESALSQGLWAVLFVALFLWTMRSNTKREEKYREMINGLIDNLGDISEKIRKLYEKLKVRDD